MINPQSRTTNHSDGQDGMQVDACETGCQSDMSSAGRAESKPMLIHRQRPAKTMTRV
jgi:hypothetical protein